jgi:hypothetical protein
MTFRERVVLGVMLSCLVIATLGPCEPQPIERSSYVVDDLAVR